MGIASPSSISDLNKKRWAGRLARRSCRDEGLFPPEVVVIGQIRQSISGKRILDIGIGTGRTTEALRALSRNYVGIDYSPEMLRAARVKFPDADLRCVDARNLADFADGSFDLVWFSYNGIDYASHEDRLRILREIHRVAAPNGHFYFTSHNRDYSAINEATRLHPARFTLNPARMLLRTALYLASIYNAWTLRSIKADTEQFAICNDSALNHRLMTYYIRLADQVRQLEATGFRDVMAFDPAGNVLDLREPHTASTMIHYFCRKP